MKVKKYVAPTMPEVMHKVKQDLGSDAIILRSKEIKTNGFIGLFKKSNIEVVAALDPDVQTEKKEDVVQKNRFNHPKLESIGENTDILREIHQLKKMVSVHQTNMGAFPPAYQKAYAQLVDQEVSDDLASDIVLSVLTRHQEEQVEQPEEQIHESIKHEIKSMVDHVSYQGVTYDKKIIRFIGPTGVGKTTTLAKIAASSVLKDKKKVAFITVDTYRIAAIEQLKTYAEILDIPFEVAYNLDDYKRALNEHKQCDLIVVDTAGRNFRDESYVKELEEHIGFSDVVETYLVLSLTTKQKDILEIYDRFKHLGIQQVIFTKLDETTQYGNILNLIYNKDVGVSYLTNGQDVPDDVIYPSSELISEYIAGDVT